MKKATLVPLQNTHPAGFLEVVEAMSCAEHMHKHFLCSPLNSGHTIYRAQRPILDTEAFYAFLKGSDRTLDKLFTVQNESTGDLLVVFVAEVRQGNVVRTLLILTDDAWKTIIHDSNQTVLRVEQFYLNVLEPQMQLTVA